MIYRLLQTDNLGSGTGDTFNIPDANGQAVGLVQFAFGGATGTVQIQGRLSSEWEWVDLLTAGVSADGAAAVAVWPQMRAVVTGLGGAGTLDVGLLV